MSAFTAQAFLEKLSRLTLSQESIETLSLWIIHHKAHAQLAVDLWLQEVKKAGADKRLVLFYLANDILQNGRRRGAGEFLDLFQDPLRQSVTMIGGQKIQTSVERMLRIWKDRRLYDNAFLKELTSLIEPATKPEVEESVAEFKLPLLVDALIEFGKFEAELKVKSSQLSNLRVDVSNPSTSLSLLKDKSAGGRVSQEFEDASQKLQDYCECLGVEVNERINILDMLKECKKHCSWQLAEVERTLAEYKRLDGSVKSLKVALDQRVKELERANSTAMSDPSAKEDITDVGDMEIESDGEGQDNDNKSKQSQPAPPTAPPPLPPPPPPTPPTSNSDPGPGMLPSPLTAQQYDGGSVPASSDGYDGGVQQTSSVKVGQQPYQQQQAYSTMFVDNVYGQQRAPQSGIPGPLRAPVSTQGRPMRYPMRGRGFPLPRHPVLMDGTRVGGFRSPGMPMRISGPRGIRTGSRPLFRPAHNSDSFSADSNNDLAQNTGSALTEGNGRDLSENTLSQSDPFDVVKNMLLGIAKKALDQKKMAMEDQKDGISSADSEEKEEAHVISSAPVHYHRPPAKELPKDEDSVPFDELDGAPYSPVAEDGVPFSPTTNDITMENKEESLPSLSSDSPTGDGPEPNMDNPILQALYSAQESPRDQLESPEDDLHTSTTQHSPNSQRSTTSPHSPSALELLRAEESDQEEELTSTDLKNILDQVKSGDADTVESPTPDSSENSVKPALPSSIPITSKLTNLLDQIFPQISQSLIDRKRKQADDLGGGVNESLQQNASDVKAPRLVLPNNLTESHPSALQATVALPPSALQPRPPGAVSYRALQGHYPSTPGAQVQDGMQPRLPGMHPGSQRGSPGLPGYMSGPSRNTGPPGTMLGPLRITGPPGAMPGPQSTGLPGNMLGPPRITGPPGPIQRSSGPPGTMSGPPRSTGPPGAMSGPPRSMGPGAMSGPPRSTGLPGTMSGPPRSTGPPGSMSGLPRGTGLPGTMSGPPRGTGPPGTMSGPPGSSGPPGIMSALSGSMSGSIQTGHAGSLPGPPGNLSGPSSGMAGPRPLFTSSIPPDSIDQAPHPAGASPDFRYRTPPLGMGARGHPGGPRLRIGFRPMARGPPQGYRPMRPRF